MEFVLCHPDLHSLLVATDPFFKFPLFYEIICHHRGRKTIKTIFFTMSVRIKLDFLR